VVDAPNSEPGTAAVNRQMPFVTFVTRTIVYSSSCQCWTQRRMPIDVEKTASLAESLAELTMNLALSEAELSNAVHLPTILPSHLPTCTGVPPSHPCRHRDSHTHDLDAVKLPFR